jgi:ribonuclease E
MANKMLIDAGHPEETRVVVVRGNRVEEFDFEAANRKQLRGNIYLAKVTRVEPSLQAAFVEYGGNRHGFLAFSEIHPDYYQIPVADREALLAAEAADRQKDEAEADEKPKRRRRSRAAKNEASESVASEKVDDEAAQAAEKDDTAAENGDQADDVVSARAPEGDDAGTLSNPWAPKTPSKRFPSASSRCASTTRSRKSSSAGRSFWSRWSRKSAATRAPL